MASIRKRLQRIDCPYVEGVDDDWISELLFTPGEARLRLLHWLLIRFDGKLHRLLDGDGGASSKTKIDSRIQRLLFVCNLLELCRKDDVELIKGTCSVSQQKIFWNNLIDMVCVVEEAEESTHQSGPRQGSGLERRFRDTCTFLDTFLYQETMDEVFKTKIQLYPPDLTRNMKKLQVDGKSIKRPMHSHLTEIANKMSEELTSQTKRLEALLSKHPRDSADASSVEKLGKSMHLAMRTLEQMMASFLHCYEADLQHWSHSAKLPLSEIGPSFQRVYQLLQQFTQLLQNLSQIYSSQTHLVTNTELRLQKIAHTLVPISRSALSSMKNCVDILEQSHDRYTCSPSARGGNGPAQSGTLHLMLREQR